jgi:hypothetical protein
MKFISAVLILITGLLFIDSCKKSDIKPGDFRNKYIGKYEVVEHVGSYGSIECGEPYSRERDTVIIVNYGETDTTINVFGRDVKLDSSGIFYDYHYSLRLWNDSIKSYLMNGGLGCGQIVTYLGRRVSEEP